MNFLKKIFFPQNIEKKELLENKEFLKKYLDVSGALMLFLNKEGRVILVNKVCEKILGYKEDEIIGHNWFKKFTPEQNEEKIRELLEKDDSYTENIVLTKNDDEKMIKWYNKVIKDDEDNPAGVIMSGIDITSQKHSKELLESYNKRLKALNKIMILGNKSKDLKTLLEDVLEAVMDFINFDNGEVYLISKEVADIIDSEKVSQKKNIKINGKEFRKVLDEKKSIIVYDYKKTKSRNKKNTKSLLMVPIIMDQKIIGAIKLTSIEKQLVSQKDMNTLELLGRTIGQEIKTIMSKNELQSEKEKLTRIFENVRAGIILSDEEGRILDFNPAAEKIFGIKKSEAENMNIWELYNIFDEKHFHKKDYNRMVKKGEIKNKTFNTTIDTEKKTKYLLISLSKVKKKNQFLILQLINDITESKEKEKQEKMTELRKEFLMRVTHELKQPLTPIMGYAGLLKHDANTPEQEEYLQRIISNSYKMKDLVNRVLNIMKMDAGALSFDFKKVDLSVIILDAITTRKSFINLKNIEIIKDLKSVKIKGDYERLKEVFVNLVDNAVKFSEKNSKIEVKMSIKEDKVIAYVKDYGVGIKEEEQEKVFKKYEQAEDGKRQGGFGVGLAMSKHIVEKHEGSISLESKYGKGSKFIIKLPKEK